MKDFYSVKGLYTSPAKVNLFFRVLSKRKDGYHEIASLMQAISLFDELQVSISKEENTIQLSCQHPDVPLDRNNLIYQAIEIFKRYTTLNFSCQVDLIKRIPMQAGLGGGSSNAATTLWALNDLLDTRLSHDELKRLAAQIGSDVPFFFSSGQAYCTGRGEHIQEVETYPVKSLWVVKPYKYHLSTPIVYKNCLPHARSSEDPLKILRSFSSGGTYINDLEPAAFKLLPELANFKSSLYALGFDHVMMTGSGSAFICIGSPIRKLPDDAFCKQVEPIFKPLFSSQQSS